MIPKLKILKLCENFIDFDIVVENLIDFHNYKIQENFIYLKFTEEF